MRPFALFLAALPALAQEASPAAVDYCFGFLRAPAERAQLPQDEVMRIQKMHLEHLGAMHAKGQLLAAGPLLNSTSDLRGVLIFRGAPVAEAKSWAEEDPAVKANRLWVDLYAWRAPAGIGERYNKLVAEGAKPAMLRHQLIMLRKTPQWKGLDSAEFRAAAPKHGSQIQAWLKEGKLLSAGPLSDSPVWLGVLVFSAGSLDAAKALAATDPLVQSGLATIEAYEWMAADGAVR